LLILIGKTGFFKIRDLFSLLLKGDNLYFSVFVYQFQYKINFMRHTALVCYPQMTFRITIRIAFIFVIKIKNFDIFLRQNYIFYRLLTCMKNHDKLIINMIYILKYYVYFRLHKILEFFKGNH
jgi:hypothetical protein